MALLKNFASKENIKIGGGGWEGALIRSRKSIKKSNMKEVIAYLYADRNNPTKCKKFWENSSITMCGK